jgi:hypothetical protein
VACVEKGSFIPFCQKSKKSSTVISHSNGIWLQPLKEDFLDFRQVVVFEEYKITVLDDPNVSMVLQEESHQME